MSELSSQTSLVRTRFFPSVLGEEEQEQQDEQKASGSGLSDGERATVEDKPKEAVKAKALQNPIQPTRCKVIEHM